MGDELDLIMPAEVDDAVDSGVGRREFLKKVGIAMTGLTAMAALLEGCGGGNGLGQNNLLAAVLGARNELGVLHNQAFNFRNPDQAILLGWMNSLNLIMAAIFVLILQASQNELRDSAHPDMVPFLAGLGGPLLFAGLAPVITLALLNGATDRTESNLGALPFGDIRGMWIFFALLALMLPGLGNPALLALAQYARTHDTGDCGGTIFDAFLGSGATGIGNPAIFLAAALVLYGIMGIHLNGKLDLLLGPRMGALLMLMLLVSFVLRTP